MASLQLLYKIQDSNKDILLFCYERLQHRPEEGEELRQRAHFYVDHLLATMLDIRNREISLKERFGKSIPSGCTRPKTKTFHDCLVVLSNSRNVEDLNEYARIAHGLIDA